MSVTAFFVTRNHEQCLGRAIQSLGTLAGEVIVADAGSTDRTTAVAVEQGAKVLPIRWADDFSAACNDALAAATGEWILWLNPDEELEPNAHAAILAAVADPTSFVWNLGVRQLRHPNDPGHGPTGMQLRLFRRDPAIRFVGRLHPEFAPPLEEIAARRGQSIGMSRAVIRRHAYLSVPTPDKMRWVVRLLEAELSDRPGQVGFTIELGRNLLWLNDPRGHAVLAEAAEQVQRLAGNPAPPSPWVGSLIEYLLAVSPEQSRSSMTRAEARDFAIRWFPRTPPILWAVAGERFAAKDYATAATFLERLIRMGRTGVFDEAEGFPPDIIASAAAFNLGICCLHLARWDDARAHFTQAMDDTSRRGAAVEGYRLADLKQRPA